MSKPEVQAIFEFTETSYIEAVWRTFWPEYDWLAAIYRDGPDQPWRMTSRFRYYRDDKVWGSDDEKSVTHARLDPGKSAEQTMARACEILDLVQSAMRLDPEMVRTVKHVVQGGGEKLMQMLQASGDGELRHLAPEPKEVQ